MRYVLSNLGQGLRRNLSMHLAVILTLFVSLTLVGAGALLNRQAEKTSDQLGSELEEHTPYPISLTLSLSYRSVAPALADA